MSRQCPGEADAAGPGTTLPERLSHWQLSNCALRSEVRAAVVFRRKVFMTFVSLLSRVRLFATPRTVACRSPLSIGFPRQES